MNSDNPLVTNQNDQDATTHWFRTAAPYIRQHRGATFVIAIDGETLASDQTETLLHDIAILNSLGVRLVLVYGARPQIETECQQQNIDVVYHKGLRITDINSLNIVKTVVGKLHLNIESRLSFGLPNTPMADAHIRCMSGNLVTARPAGIIDGVDLEHTGEVRRIDNQGINQQLDLGNIVLLPPLGYSLTGEVFNLSSRAIAAATAVSLKADKLIYIGHSNQDLPRELTVQQANQQLDKHPTLEIAVRACASGVKRVHLLDRALNGALLQELFSRDGAGTLLSATSFESIRQATIDDVSGILELLAPLEKNGSLVKRSRELLEQEIGHFTVMERDNAVIACAAIYPYADNSMLELACLVVSPHYQKQGRAEQLLTTIEHTALEGGFKNIYVLTTQTMHWFLEHGFINADIQDLPVEKQALYNYQRNSKVLRKSVI